MTLARTLIVLITVALIPGLSGQPLHAEKPSQPAEPPQVIMCEIGDRPTLTISAPVTDEADAQDKMAQAGRAANALAIDLYREHAGAGGNLFFSPFSISTALGMTAAGASNQTLEEMLATLHWTDGQTLTPLHAHTGMLVNSLNDAGREGMFELAVANRLWLQDGYDLLPQYLEKTRRYYDAEPILVDYVQATEQARRTINRWVEQQTRDRIKNLIPSGALTVDTRLVLTNAIYFKGNWANQFDEKLTQDRPFHLTADNSKDVPTMHRKGTYAYRSDDLAQVLHLPYEGDRLSMVVVLPKEQQGLAALEEKMTSEHLAGWLQPVRGQEVHVYLPRFKMEWEASLKETLINLGMKDAFFDADFTAMSGARDLAISDVVHKAFVEVNEEGSEAAAATGVIVATRAAVGVPPRPIIFRADHPFLFVIKDNVSGAVLFMGRVSDPGS